MNILAKRRVRKAVKELVHQCRHLVNMRGDLLGADAVKTLRQAEQDLIAAFGSGDRERIAQEHEALTRLVEANARRHPRRGGAFRENFEIMVVAVAVAMGLRAYFIQPFKIPTGSMQPTLYGITSVTLGAPTLLDRFPLKILKFAVTGHWYSERRARADGRLGEGTDSEFDPSVKRFRIGGVVHTLPKDAVHDETGRLRPGFHPDRIVARGDLLWAGITRRGDHLFVNKVIWNFRRPRRDEVMVFKTDGIPTLPPGTHYIKRLCGMPGESIAIRPPHLYANQAPLTDEPGIARVTSRRNGYDGYQLAGHLGSSSLEWPMRENEYFALGDNTGNSRDSRYWGPVPSDNLVGPAVLVYWPLSRRWGLIR